MPKLKKKHKKIRHKSAATKRWLYTITVVLIFIGVSSGLLAGGYFIGTLRTENKLQQPAEITQVTAAIKPTQYTHNQNYAPAKITIGTRIEQPVTPQVYIQGKWEVPDKNAAYLVNSAYPYEPGNIIVYGHNTQTIFGNLKKTQKNDPVVLTLANGMTREYQITEIIEVTPDKIEYLQPTTTETLTIYTCSGFMDSKRLIIRAVPKVASTVTYQ